MKTNRIWFVVMPVLFLSGCSDPVLVGLTGTPEAPLALIDPCRTEAHAWTRLEVAESSGRTILWAIGTANGKPIDLRSVQYGQTPAGGKVINQPTPLAKSKLIQWRYTAPGAEPVLQSFDLSRLSPSAVLMTDDSENTLRDWQLCKK